MLGCWVWLYGEEFTRFGVKVLPLFAHFVGHSTLVDVLEVKLHHIEDRLGLSKANMNKRMNFGIKSIKFTHIKTESQCALSIH
jgi:hypothetical protein